PGRWASTNGRFQPDRTQVQIRQTTCDIASRLVDRNRTKRSVCPGVRPDHYKPIGPQSLQGASVGKVRLGVARKRQQLEQWPERKRTLCEARMRQQRARIGADAAVGIQ